MNDDVKVLLRLSPDTVAVYRALVSNGDFSTMTDAIRTVLESYADEKVAEGVTPIYDIQTIDISELSSDGRSLDDMVRAAAKRYMDEKSIGERLG